MTDPVLNALDKQREAIAAYIDAEAKRRKGGLAIGFRVLASNIRAWFDQKDGEPQ